MIIALESQGDSLRQFVDLPCSVYRGDRHYCAPSRQSVLSELANFSGQQQGLLGMEGETCVARLVSRVSPTLRSEDGRPIGMIGHFEAVDRPNVAKELLAAAVDWLRQQHVGEIVGPLDGDTWHRYRFNIGPYERPPFLREPYNPPFYARLWEQAGFVPLEDYYSKHVADIAGAAAALRPIRERVLSQGYQLRPIDLSRFEDELRILYELTLEIFADNYLYEPISWEQFRSMYQSVRPMLDSTLVWFGTAPDGQRAGFLFAYRDYHRAVTAMRGGNGLLAKLRFLYHRHEADTVNLKTLGVLEPFRRSGLAAALMCQGYESAQRLGLKHANLCLIREGNPSGRLEGGLGEILRRYRLYRYAGASPA